MNTVEQYQQHGYVRLADFFSETELGALEPVLRSFHERWLINHKDHYDHGAINSAYLTHKESVEASDRRELFNFIASDKIMEVANRLIPAGPAFMNTQLFFDPKNPDQKNYWHRDIQYTDHSVEEQRQRLQQSNVIHFRVPVVDECGLEIVPGTHRRWDTEVEYATRTETERRKSSDDLPGTQVMKLHCGDLLVFSANMIHRGLYGGSRFALDIIFSDADRELLQFVDEACLPNTTELAGLSNPQAFASTLKMIST